MRKLTATLCLTLAVILGSAGASWGNGRVKPFEILETKFFVVLYADTATGQETSQEFETTLVPHMPRKSCYGWGIKVSTADTLIKFREEFTLPAEPKFWSGENNEFATNRIINKRRTSITNEFSKPDKGWVKKVWCVVKGDPEGKYSIKVFFNDQFIKNFDFEVRRM